MVWDVSWHPRVLKGHILQEQLNLWIRREAKTAGEGQTDSKYSDACSSAVGMRWSTKNRHPYSTTITDILWDGVGIHLTFSGLGQLAKLAKPYPHFISLLGQFFTGLTPKTMPWVCSKYQTKEIEGNRRGICQTGLFYQAVHPRKSGEHKHTARLQQQWTERLLGVQRRLCEDGFNP